MKIQLQHTYINTCNSINLRQKQNSSIIQKASIRKALIHNSHYKKEFWQIVSEIHHQGY